MAVFSMPRGSSKPMLHMNADSISISSNTKTFPRKSGFDSSQDLHFTLGLLTTFKKDFDISIKLLDITAHTTHLGINYFDYILLNIHEFIIIVDSMQSIKSGLTKELIYSKALSRLITVNIFRQHRGDNYSLPDVLSRKFIDIKYQILEYYNNETQVLRMGIL